MIRHFAVAMNFIIALAYLGIGLYVAPKFSIAAGAWGAKVARLAGLLFFVTCAGTHTELAVHAAQSPDLVGEWFHSAHGLAIHTVQGIAGWLFCVLAIKYLNVRIMNRSHYEAVLDERIEQLKAELARDYGGGGGS